MPADLEDQNKTTDNTNILVPHGEQSGRLIQDSDADDESIPPISVYVEPKDVWKFVKWPLCFLVVNAILIALLIFFSFTQYEHHVYAMGEPSSKWGLILIQQSLIGATILLWVDSFCLHFFAQAVKAQLGRMEATEEKENDEEIASGKDTIVHAKVSKIIDAFFSQGGEKPMPRTSFFPNILLVLWALLLTAGCGCGTALTCFVLFPDSTSCAYNSTNSFSPMTSMVDLNHMIASLPPKSRDWFRSTEGRGGRGHGESHQSFARLTDGSIMFSGNSMIHNSEWGGNIHEYHFNGQLPRPRGDALQATFANGTFISFPEYIWPRQFIPTGSIDDSGRWEGFCCSFQDDSVRGEYHRTPSVLCYNSTDGFKTSTATIPKSAHKSIREFEDGVSHMTSTLGDGLVWISTKWYGYSIRASTEIVKVDTLDPSSMKRTNVATLQSSNTDVGDFTCLRGMKWFILCMSLFLLISLSFWLQWKEGVSSSIVPAIFGMVAVLVSTDFFCLGEVVSIIGVYGLVFALWKPNHEWVQQRVWNFIDKESAIWAIYSTFIGVAICSAILDSDYYPVVAFILLASAFLVPLLLNHPIFQFLGAISGIVATIVLIGSIVFPPAIIVAVFYFILSFGLTTFGHFVMKYRWHMVIYGKRGWRFIKGKCGQILNRSKSRAHSQEHASR